MASSTGNIFIKTSCFLLFILLTQCLAPAEVKTDFSSGRLIVSGQVSTVPHRNMVQVGRTAGTERRQFDISGAIVRIVDDQGNSYTCTETLPGIYKPSEFAGKPGVTYHVEVDVDEQHYESVPETLPTAVGAETISYDFERKEVIDRNAAVVTLDFINIRSKVDIQSPAEPYYLHWEVSETWLLVPTDFPDPFSLIPPNCYVTQAPDPQRVVLFDGRDKPSLNQELLIASRVADQSFRTKHVFLVYQGSLTPQAYEYWRKVGILVSQVGTIFDTPPAEIIGNISNTADPSEKVYGYFQANNEVYTRLPIYSSDLPFLPLPYCEYEASKRQEDYPFECLDCTKARNASYVEPETFKD